MRDSNRRLASLLLAASAGLAVSRPVPAPGGPSLPEIDAAAPAVTGTATFALG